MITSIYREAHFNACHRMHNPNWSDEKNASFYGLCNSPNYHGHNFRLIVKLTGEIDPETGYIMDLKVLSQLIEENVALRFDHKNLNLDCPEFKDTLASTENFCWVIFNIIRPLLPEHLKLSIKLLETDRNSAEVSE
jgi:6-pyruvoyltetrahydropterin/6-carboxytetrahydropterin synthase